MMKTIRINGVDQGVSADNLVFEDFIKDLNKTLNQDSQVISSIKVDGKEISENDEEIIKKTPLGEVGVIEVFTSSPMDLAYETLNTLEQYMDRLIASVERAAIYYRDKNLIAADGYFVKAIDGLDLFVQTIGGIKLALRIGLHQQIAIAEATLVSVMNDLLEAKRQNNYVYMAELLEKELIGNLNEWKAEIFPLFRTWKTA